MNAFEFVIKILDQLIWPLTLIIIVILLRGSIGSLIPKTKYLRTKNFEAYFSEKLEKAELGALTADLPGVELQDNSNDFVRFYHKLSELSPVATVLASWREVEIAISPVLNRSDAGFPSLSSVKKIFKSYTFNEATITLFNDLRLLRNKIAHSSDGISNAKAFEYAILAHKLAIKVANEIGSKG
jgi:hypothetical protein